MNIDEIVNSAPPVDLYHYTNQQGLLGIVNNKEIWSTKAHYLNDSREFSYAIDLVNEVLSSKKYSKNEDAQELKTRIGYVTTVNVCVTSFTKNGDLLSQWRGYGEGGVGYSIGLIGAELKRLANAQRFILCPVIYEKSDQILLVREIIERWLAGTHHVDGLTPTQDEPPEFEDYFAMLAPMFKDPSFKEEGEWRLISPMLSCDLDRFSFRAGRYFLIPYYRFSLEEPTISFSLSKIVVGPSPMQDLSKLALDSFLYSKDMHDVPTQLSCIPYREW
jgi:hypothetical protein